MTVEEFNKELLDGELKNTMLNPNCSLRGLLHSMTDGTDRIEDYGDIDIVMEHFLKPVGYHIEIVKDEK